MISSLLVWLFLSHELIADSCGMVPPVFIPEDQADGALKRTGAQRTYVFYRNGMETIALRPGFEGKVDDFGMLIPFPSPPAIRKIEDNVFAHIEGALAPPKVRVTIQKYRPRPRRSARRSSGMKKSKSSAAPSLRYDEVRVLSEEAVGMYQVAVLEAGSSAALQRWMDTHGYRYPAGMEKVTDDYVGDRWCFVAIKATVGQAPGVRPQAGMRKTDVKLPDDATFDGHVQGMAFRFAAEEPVIPMRLSVFNGKDPRNVVYVVAETPVKINGVSEGMVLQQMKGEKLHHNLMEKLELVVTGNQKSLSEETKKTLKSGGILLFSVARRGICGQGISLRPGRELFLCLMRKPRKSFFASVNLLVSGERILTFFMPG